jgi:hypothetical protein
VVVVVVVVYATVIIIHRLSPPIHMIPSAAACSYEKNGAGR